MQEIVDALRAEQDALAQLVEPVGPTALRGPSRCEGWTVADVLLHLAQTNELAVASAEGVFPDAVASGPDAGSVASVDEWAEAAVAAERDGHPEGARARWSASAAAQAAALARCDPSRRLDWVVGTVAARTLATTRLSETWIHSGDIAWGLGVEHRPTDRLWHIARLAHRTLPYAFDRAGRHLAGPVAFELSAPSGDTWTLGADDPPVTIVRGRAVELCEVAGQRRDARDTSLSGAGPDTAAVLELVRTFA